MFSSSRGQLPGGKCREGMVGGMFPGFEFPCGVTERKEREDEEVGCRG